VGFYLFDLGHSTSRRIHYNVGMGPIFAGILFLKIMLM
jgi:hypothetical protein